MLKSLFSIIFFAFLFLLFICSLLYVSATENFLEESSLTVSVADMPREDISLFFQRLSSGDSSTTREFRFGVDQRNKGNNLFDRRTSEEAKKEKRRKIIVRPLVNAALHGSASSVMPNTRISIINIPTTTIKTTTILNKGEKNIGELKEFKSLQKYESTENISIKSTLGKMSWIVLIVIVGLFFSLATTIGNALVMLSICVDRKLQTISNYFLFSLAVADLTIGLISIPLMTLYTANETWTFGFSLCQFWLCIDYLMCNASALNLLLISFDRYFSVTRPLTYRPKRTTKKALIMIACTYIISLLLWPPWIVLWPYMEGRFIVEESSVCVVQFLVLGDTRNLVNQLATLFTSAAAFYIPVTLMIVLYYKVYLETRRRGKELKKLQAGQQFFAPSSKLAGTPALQSLLLPLAPLIRGLQPPTPPPPTLLSENSTNTAIFNLNKNKNNNSFIKSTENSKINFIDILMGNKSSNNIYTNNSIKKKRERFSLLKFCTGRNITTQSSSEYISTEDSIGIECDNNTNNKGEEEEEETLGGLTTSNLDSILAEQTAIELVEDGGEFKKEENWESLIVAKAKERREALIEEEKNKNKLLQFQYLNKEGTSFRSVGSGKMPIVELERTSRPSSVHTYNSIVIIEYPEGGGEANGKGGITSQRPSVRLSSHAEVESLSTRNSVERRFIFPSSTEQNPPEMDLKNQKTEEILKESPSSNSLERQRLRLTKSAPGGGSIRSTNLSLTQQSQLPQQQNGVLMRKSEIQMIREEQMRQSEKEKRRNERKQESKAAKTLSAILCAFIITCTPYHVIVCLEAFYPNSVPVSLFTISYFLSYINSTINPLCYALCNARFRMTYMKIIRCKWWGSRRRQSSGINTQTATAAFLHHHRQMRQSGRKALLKGRHRTT